MNYLKYLVLLLLIYSVRSRLIGVFEPPSDNFNIGDFYDDTKVEDNDIANNRISNLEDQAEKFNKKWDDFRRNDINKYNELLNSITNIDKSLVYMSKMALPPHFATYIPEKDFRRAEEALKLILYKDFDEVIYYAYRDNSQNFKTIINFADILYNRTNSKTFHLYDQLLKKATKNNHASIDDFKFMVNNIKKRYNDVNNDWSDLKRRCLDVILTKTMEIITNSVNKYDSNYSNDHMESLYHLDHEVGLKLMSEVVRKLYRKQDLGKLIPYIHKHTNLPLRVRGFVVLYDKIQQNKDYDDSNLFYLGTMIRITLGEPSLDRETKAELVALKDALPKSIKAASMSWEVCIQNKMSNNYLKVSDQNRASEWKVIASIGETMYTRTKWRFEAMHDGVYIMLKNIFLNRNIKKTDISVWMPTKQYGYKVGISLPMNTGDNWLLEADGDYCYIKSKETLKYLSDHEGGLVISDLKNDSSKWNITEC